MDDERRAEVVLSPNEEYPYIFTVESGNLYVQYWDDASTRTLLANNVSQISSCKGWQSSVDIDLDQGLIIGYLRDGAVFYRALCCQHDGSYVWEAEREVTTLGSGNPTLSVSRTNDPLRVPRAERNDMLLTLTPENTLNERPTRNRAYNTTIASA